MDEFLLMSYTSNDSSSFSRTRRTHTQNKIGIKGHLNAAAGSVGSTRTNFSPHVAQFYRQYTDND